MAPSDPIPNSEVTALVHPCTKGISTSMYVKCVSAGGKECVDVLLFMLGRSCASCTYGISASLHVSRTLLDFYLEEPVTKVTGFLLSKI